MQKESPLFFSFLSNSNFYEVNYTQMEWEKLRLLATGKELYLIYCD